MENDILDHLIRALLLGLVGFLASLLLRRRQGVLGSVGVGFLGWGIGVWLFGLIKVAEPVPLTIRGASIPLVETFVGSLIVVLIDRLIRGRGKF